MKHDHTDTHTTRPVEQGPITTIQTVKRNWQHPVLGNEQKKYAS